MVGMGGLLEMTIYGDVNPKAPLCKGGSAKRWGIVPFAGQVGFTP